MFGTNFYHGTMRRYFLWFESIFSDVYIDRSTPDGKTARMYVPITFAKKEKALGRVLDDPNIDKPEAVQLPTMAFDLIDMKYAGERTNATMNRVAMRSDDPNKFLNAYVPVQYDLHFRLYVLVKNVDDGLKIIEQVTPFFRPDVSARLEILPEMGIIHEIPLTLESIALEDSPDKNYTDRVTHMWVMDFVMQAVLYGPVKKTPVIKFANVVFTGTDGTTSSPFLKVTSQPGMDANGNPTTNPDLTVPYLTIAVDDNYDYIDRTYRYPIGD